MWRCPPGPPEATASRVRDLTKGAFIEGIPDGGCRTIACARARPRRLLRTDRAVTVTLCGPDPSFHPSPTADNRRGAKGDRSLVTFCGRGRGSFPVPRSARRFAVWAHSTGMGCGWQLELGCGRLCLYRWWVRGWEICRSYQNCASRRDSHGHGSQAAQPGLAQLILVFPSGVLSSTGRCVAMRRGRASVVACMSSLLPSGSGQACWSWFHLPGFKRLPPARADLFCADSPPPPEALTVQT